MGELRLVELDASNIVAANSLTLKPGQDAFAIPESLTIAQTYVNPSASWHRVVVDDDDVVVGFIMGNFDAAHPQEEYRSALLRINIEGERQGQGVGRFAVEALLAEAKARGLSRVTSVWDRDDQGPEQFFLRLGFVVIGETQFGEAIGELHI
jgi:diamine N-acetyltransferase